MHAAEKGWSLDAQICEQQGGKREAWLNTGFGADCALSNLENKIMLNKWSKKKKKTREEKRHEETWGGPKVC